MRTARDLAIASLTSARDLDAWLDLFAEECSVEDPVGPSAWDPEGRGHRGKAAIAAFHEAAITHTQDIGYTLHKEVLCGDEFAVFLTLHITMKDGTRRDVEAINVYTGDGQGRLKSLRSFWN
jgi:ketosteroid isomerase-like protein